LDEALAQGSQEGWSEARVKAYKLKDKNPNAYYYRFNDPGEAQKNGKWTREEVQLFYNRMEEVGVDGQWGIFSRTIPGRVGYQCSNYYRFLIETGRVRDVNYEIDEKGKAHYIFKGGKKRKGKDEEDSTENGSSRIARKTKRKKKSKAEKEEDEEEEEEEEYMPSSEKRRRKNCSSDEENVEKPIANGNPLPGYLDPITLEEVEKPAISPYGHVMSYATWIRCLQQEPKNRCPITKKDVKKRDLVILDWENIDQYRDKIVHLN